ncbi:MAG: cytochrome c biogenesis protein ResB [Deltaproteobacteria bacterium]|nr:cytochrome c biogenesis protein ResB [Deltaproteobacteria bacterium]
MTKASDSHKPANRLWNFFASVKLSVAILLSIAVTSIIGTVVPQNGAPEAYVEKYGKFLYNFFNTLDILDLYHSWWFQGLLFLLIINIVVCSINRLSSTWKIIFPKKPIFNMNQFKKSANREEWTQSHTVEEAKNLYVPYISKRFSFSRVDETDAGFKIFAEKGRWTRLGVYVVHFSILCLLTGSLIGSFFGFDGYVNIPVGKSADHVTLKNKGVNHPLGFAIRCDDFKLRFYDTGMPKEFRSTLTIIKNNKIIKQKDIIVNDPLRYDGVNMFQASYGKMPADRFTVILADVRSGIKYKKGGAIRRPIELPDKSGYLIFEQYRQNFRFNGRNIGEVLIGGLIPKTGEQKHIIIPLDSPGFDRMRNGRFVISVSNFGFKYYTGLQVTRDPGVPLVYAGFLLMIIGCYITFFMFHQKVCVELTSKGGKTGGKTQITVSGISGKSKTSMKTIVKRLARNLKRIQSV